MPTDDYPSNPRILRSIFLIVIVLGAGLGVAAMLYATREEPPRRELSVPPPLVDSIVVRAEEITEWFAGYGTALPDRTAELAAEVAATVVELVDDVEAGSVVSEGQVLVRLDDREYQYTLERAEALIAADEAALEELRAEAEKLQQLLATAERELRVSENERDRVAGLYEGDLAARKEFDFADLAYQQARRILQGYQLQVATNAPRQTQRAASIRSHEADARIARLTIERCRIRAPFDGTIDRLNVERGDRVAPGTVVMRLIDPSHVDIPLQLPASVYDRVARQAPCRIASERMSEVFWEGRVERVAASVDENTRTFPVYVEVDNARQAQPLVPGTFVRADVQGPLLRDALLVPRVAIRDGAVMVVNDGAAHPRSVTIKRLIGDRALVEGELRCGDRVILSHLDRLAAGAPVRIGESVTASSADQSVGEGREP